jgi:hypothetical protein
MAQKLTLIFVHGYSVTNLDSYGELPLRLREEGKNNGLDINVEEIFLGRYISFHDEVKLNDISRAFETALKEQLPNLIANKERFTCITHSTGGPVIRNWWNMYYNDGKSACPMSHLIMLAPANYGSALAQLGKGKLSRLASWFNGVEPGQGVLDWLELGSSPAWELNKKWIMSDGSQISEKGIFPFVITGQSIDRKLYDNLNSYTGELGSDGVVRAATCNMNARYVRLKQYLSKPAELVIEEYKEAPAAPYRIVKGQAHSNDDMGVMRSVRKELSDTKSIETVKAIFDCIKVKNTSDYTALISKFATETAQVQKEELLEVEKSIFKNRYFIHDRFSQIIFKIKDSEGFAITDFDLVLTAGARSDPNHLPEGFFADRQQNRINRETVTYFFNYDIMNGCAAVKNAKGEEIRAAQPGTTMLGLEIRPRPNAGFVRYMPCKINASKELLDKALVPNSTTLLEITLQRVVSNEVYRNEKLVDNTMPTKKQGDFSKAKPGEGILGE